MIDGVTLTELTAEGAAIRATLEASRASAAAAAAALAAAAVRRLYVIGNGTSYHSALAAATWYRRHSGAESPSVVALTAGEFSHYLPALGSRDAVVAISASGEFRDVLGAVAALRGRVTTVGIVHAPDSSLERLADHVVRAAGGQSRTPVMTKTFASTLTATLMVLAELLGEAEASAARAALADAAADVDAALRSALQRVLPLADALAGCEHLFVIGSGNATPAALEAALKLKEMAIVHAEGAEAWEMASGGATIVGPESVVVAIAPAGRGREATLDVARHAAGWGARIVEVGPGAGPAVAGADHLPLPQTAAEDLAPLTAVAPVALLALALARRRGHDPDRPDWIERYHDQGLRHIVGV